MNENEFGLTKDAGQIREANEYREAMIADGWECSPAYDGENVERAAHLRRNGWVCHVIARPIPDNRKWKAKVQISIWAPDGLFVAAPQKYDFAEILKNSKTCSGCGKVVEKAVRFSFAGRCCPECLPQMRAKHEKPGWDA